MVTLLGKQHDFLIAATDPGVAYSEVLSSGAFGSGKSRALCYTTVARAAKPGAREGLFRKTRKSLVPTTLKTLIDGDGEMPPVLPLGSYTHNKSESVIKIKGGGEIVYGGLDDPGKIGSLNLTGAGVDQVEELSELDWDSLKGRTRVQLRGMRNVVYGVCNPSTPSHWLCDRFDLSVQSGFGVSVFEREGCRSRTVAENGEVRFTLRDDRYAQHTRTDENKHLPEQYLEQLRQSPRIFRQRNFEGLWVGADGLVYDKWNRDKHVVARDFVPVEVIVSVDEGYTNPFAVGRYGIDGDGGVHKFREWYERGCVLATKKAIVLDAMGADRGVVVVDPSAADLIAELRNIGLNVVAANNEVFDGIIRVQSRLGKLGERPRLTIDPSCVNTCREFESYEWKPGKDAPVKANDHAMDEVRYCIMHIDAGTPIGSAAVMASRERSTKPVAMAELRKDPDWGFN